MKLRLILFFLIAALETAIGQSINPSIRALYKISGDGVWVRWAPADFITWQLGNRYGYRIERYKLKADGTLENEEPVLLSPGGIKPYTIQQLEELAREVEEAAVLQELIYHSGQVGGEDDESPFGLLKQQDDMNNRFGMALLVCDLSLHLAEAAGLFWKDHTAVKGLKYIYKISLNENPSKAVVGPAVMVVNVTEPKPLNSFSDVKANFGDKKLTLSWSVLTHRGVYSAYIIERSTDGISFRPVSDLPYMPMSESDTGDEVYFVDSLTTNDQTFYYRIKGITPFGEEGPPSNVVSGKGKDDLSGLVVIREVISEGQSKAILHWEFPVSYESKISGFVIGKAPKAEGPYKEVNQKTIKPEIREAIDVELVTSSYYRIEAVNREGKTITHSQPYYLHVEDNTPPTVPQELSGRADKSGKVMLKWKANTDTDLLGYRIFSAHDLKHEFIEVTSQIISSNAYTDTINTSLLNKKIYYVVLAVDNNFNTSDFSVPVTIDRPDLIAPAAPVFTKAEREGETISLHWVNSISDDVVNYALYRSVIDDTIGMKLISSWDAAKAQTAYVDDNIPLGNTCQYILTVMDNAGNEAAATSKKVKFESGVRDEVTDLKAIIDRERKIITLKWAYDIPIKRCLLYRKKGEEPYTLYQSIDGSLSEFVDRQVIVNTTYWYKIQLVAGSNARTKLSKALKVPF